MNLSKHGIYDLLDIRKRVPRSQARSELTSKTKSCKCMDCKTTTTVSWNDLCPSVVEAEETIGLIKFECKNCGDGAVMENTTFSFFEKLVSLQLSEID